MDVKVQVQADGQVQVQLLPSTVQYDYQVQILDSIYNHIRFTSDHKLSDQEIFDRLVDCNLEQDRYNIKPEFTIICTNGFNYAQKCYQSMTVRNDAIYKRLDRGLEPLSLTTVFSQVYFVQFDHMEHDEIRQKQLNEKLGHYAILFPARRTSTVLPFIVLNRTDQYINIMLLKPKQLNYGYGPTEDSRYYQLHIDGHVGVFYSGLIEHLELYKRYDFSSVAQYIAHGVHEVTYNREANRLKWSALVERECCICFTNDHPLTCCLDCLQVSSCTDCLPKLDRCVQCQRNQKDCISVEPFRWCQS